MTRYSDGSIFGFAAEVLTSFIFKGEGAGKCYNFGLSWENDAASFLHVDSGITFDSNGYLAKNSIGQLIHTVIRRSLIHLRITTLGSQALQFM